MRSYPTSAQLRPSFDGRALRERPVRGATRTERIAAYQITVARGARIRATTQDGNDIVSFKFQTDSTIGWVVVSSRATRENGDEQYVVATTEFPSRLQQ